MGLPIYAFDKIDGSNSHLKLNQKENMIFRSMNKWKFRLTSVLIFLKVKMAM